MRWIKRCFIWLGRVGHSYGYGVQSPHDYRFVREVISERQPYYSYYNIEDICKSQSRNAEKKCKLFFRIANYVQPEYIIDVASEPTIWSHAMSLGCKKAQLMSVKTEEDISDIAVEGKKCLVRVDAVDLSQLDGLLSQIANQSVMIVNDIFHKGTPLEQWLDFIRKPQVRIAFDLYHCGVVFFDSKRDKHYYKINI